MYPKRGDSTFLHDDSQKVLQRFSDDVDKFSISRYIWYKIHDATEDPVRHYLYAPYLMHVIEQVLGIRFPTDSNHKLLKITNKTSITAARELKKKADKGKCKGARVLALVVMLHHLLLLVLLALSRSLPPPLVRSPVSSSFS